MVVRGALNPEPEKRRVASFITDALLLSKELLEKGEKKKKKKTLVEVFSESVREKKQ